MDLRTAFRCRTLVQQDATITTEEVIVHLAAIVWQEGTAAAQGLRHAPLALQEKISLTLVKLHVTIAQQEGTAAAQGLRLVLRVKLVNTHQLQPPSLLRLAMTALLVDTVLPLEQHRQTLVKRVQLAKRHQTLDLRHAITPFGPSQR